jgi:hypothetical protein
LSRSGLLAAELDEHQAELKIGSTGYRCMPAFWQAVGAVAPGAAGFEQQAVSLRDPFARANLHHRVMAEFLIAGAPLWWCNSAAESALAALRGTGDAGAPPRDHQAAR